jgi:DNA topoisomerase VI subunit A
VSYFDPEEVLGIYLGPRGWVYKSNQKPLSESTTDMFSFLKPKSLSKIYEMVSMMGCIIEYQRLKDVSIREIYIDTGSVDSFTTVGMKQQDKIKHLMQGMKSALLFIKNPEKKLLYNKDIIYD